MEKHMVSEWLTKIPVIRKWLQNQDELVHKKQTFELWSVSGFSSEALELLEIRKAGVNKTKYTIEYNGRDEINTKVKETKNTKLQDIISSYFTTN